MDLLARYFKYLQSYLTKSNELQAYVLQLAAHYLKPETKVILNHAIWFYQTNPLPGSQTLLIVSYQDAALICQSEHQGSLHEFASLIRSITGITDLVFIGSDAQWQVFFAPCRQQWILEPLTKLQIKTGA